MIKEWFQKRSARLQKEREHEMQYDDSNRTPYQKFKSAVRETWDRTKYPAAMLGVVGSLYCAGLWTKAEIMPLGVTDVNQDGKSDLVVAFPLRGTGKAIVGYIDNQNVPRTHQNVPKFAMSYLDISLFDMKSLDRLIDGEYAIVNPSVGTFIDRETNELLVQKGSMRRPRPIETLARIPLEDIK